MSKVCFLSGPISNGGTATPEEMERYIYNAFEVAKELLSYDISSVMPQLSGLLKNHTDLTWRQWMDLDRPIMFKCDAVYRIPGESTGADEETIQARLHGMPVLYSIQECIEYFK